MAAPNLLVPEFHRIDATVIHLLSLYCDFLKFNLFHIPFGLSLLEEGAKILVYFCRKLYSSPPEVSSRFHRRENCEFWPKNQFFRFKNLFQDFVRGYLATKQRGHNTDSLDHQTVDISVFNSNSQHTI